MVRHQWPFENVDGWDQIGGFCSDSNKKLSREIVTICGPKAAAPVLPEGTRGIASLWLSNEMFDTKLQVTYSVLAT